MRNAIVVGAGPAGIACAIQLQRAGHAPLLYERERVGGLLHHARLVENYPGYPQGIPGTKLAESMRHHLEHWDVELRQAEVREIEWVDDHFVVHSTSDTVVTRALILALGTVPIPWEGVTTTGNVIGRIHQSPLPLLDSQDKRIAIVGGGDAAFDYALSLSDRHRVSIRHRSAGPSCLALLYEQATDKESIDISGQYVLTQIRKNSGKLELHWKTARGRVTESVDHLLLAIGRESSTLARGYRLRHIEQDLRERQLLLEIGDMINGWMRQTAIAVGDGVAAAMKVSHLLESTGQ
jgi:thioredoxin reductase